MLAVALLGCGDATRKPLPAQAQGASSGSGGEGGGWSGAGGGSSAAGGGSPAGCDALVDGMPPGQSRWYLDASPSFILPLTSALVEQRDAIPAQTTLLALAWDTDGGTELVLSTFDGAAVDPDAFEPEALPFVTIALDGMAPTRLTAAAGAGTEILVVLTGDDGTHFLRIDQGAVVDARDLGAETEVRFLLGLPGGDALFGVQPPGVDAPLTLLTGKESSIDEGYPLGCDYWFTPASAVSYGNEAMVVFSSHACPELGDDGLYMLRVEHGKPDSDIDHLDVGFQPWVPQLAVVAGMPWLVVAEVDAGYSALHARALHPLGWVIGEDRVLGSTLGTLPAMLLGDRVVTGLYDHLGHSIQVVTGDGESLGAFSGVPGWESMAPAGDAAILLAWKAASPPQPDDYLHVEQLACQAPR
jgi:hypothetical protein